MRWPLAKSKRIRRLRLTDRNGALALLDADPVGSILLRTQLEMAGPVQLSHAMGQFNDAGEITGLCWTSGNLMPWGFDAVGLDELAEELHLPSNLSSAVGPADQVLGLWERISHRMPEPREIRDTQLSMVYRGRPEVRPDPLVRAARIGEGAQVLPASRAMFMEEVGYDPTAVGSAYAQRVHFLVAAGRTFIRPGLGFDGTNQVDFKADIGALAGGVAQIQGVWTRPELRGQGIATACMVSVARLARENFADTVSLYVNDYNLAAVRVYEKAGFETVGTYATILL